MKKRKIIHKHLLKRGEIRYLCNQACTTSWLKTDITNKKINCKNCKKIIKKTKTKTSHWSSKAYINYLAKTKKEQKELLKITKPCKCRCHTKEIIMPTILTECPQCYCKIRTKRRTQTWKW